MIDADLDFEYMDDAEWTGKPFEPRETHECLYWADMPINHFPDTGKKEER